MAVSMDVIFHLVEDDVYETYMNTLFRVAQRLVLIYLSEEHVRHRRFGVWIEESMRDWSLIKTVPN